MFFHNPERNYLIREYETAVFDMIDRGSKQKPSSTHIVSLPPFQVGGRGETLRGLGTFLKFKVGTYQLKNN